MRRTGIDRCEDQHCFTRERNSCTLDGYEGQDGPITIGRKEISKVIRDTLEHVEVLPLGSLPDKNQLKRLGSLSILPDTTPKTILLCLILYSLQFVRIAYP